MYEGNLASRSKNHHIIRIIRVMLVLRFYILYFPWPCDSLPLMLTTMFQQCCFKYFTVNVMWSFGYWLHVLSKFCTVAITLLQSCGT